MVSKPEVYFIQVLSCSEQMLFPLLPNTFSSWLVELLAIEGQGISTYRLEMMVQLLSTQTSLTEELSLVPSTHSGWERQGGAHNHLVTPDPLYLTSLWAPARMYTNAYKIKK